MRTPILLTINNTKKSPERKQGSKDAKKKITNHTHTHTHTHTTYEVHNTLQTTDGLQNAISKQFVEAEGLHVVCGHEARWSCKTLHGTAGGFKMTEQQEIILKASIGAPAFVEN